MKITGDGGYVGGAITDLRVHPNDPEGIAAAIRLAVADDDLVDRAAELNARTARERLDYSIIKPQVVKMYRDIYESRNG